MLEMHIWAQSEAEMLAAETIPVAASMAIATENDFILSD